MPPGMVIIPPSMDIMLPGMVTIPPSMDIMLPDMSIIPPGHLTFLFLLEIRN